MFAVLYVADFALHAVLRQEPAAVGKPAVADGPAALFAAGAPKSVVLAATAAARAAGVAPGMTAPQAVARCPALVIRTPDARAEAEARAALLAMGFTLSPAVEATAPGVCTVDLAGAHPPFEPAAIAALTRLGTLGLPASAGLARTPLLALYAARAAGAPPAAAEPELPGLLAEAPVPYVAYSERVRLVDDERAFLAPLPLAVAEPAPELAAILAGWGLRTLGDLAALPCADLVRRCGAAGLALRQRALGGEPRPLHPVVPPRDFRAALEFETPVETLEPLLFVLRRCVDRLALELGAAQFVAAALGLVLRLEDGTRHTRPFRLPEPTADPGLLFRTLHTHLEALQTAASIVALELELEPMRAPVRQQGLFETGLRDPHGFAETLARLGALVDAGRVGTPQLADSHRPDAVRLAPPPAVVPPPAPPPLHPPPGPPLRRFRPPLLATLEFAPGTSRPTYMFTHRFHGDIAELRGPWRGSGDWWEAGRSWARTEWDVALAGGGLYRLLRIGDAFFIEGEYD